MDGSNIFLIQSAGGGLRRPGTAGGGNLLTLSMGRDWGRYGAKVHLISNPDDPGAEGDRGFCETVVLPGIRSTDLGDYASLVLGTVFNFFLQFRALRTQIVPLVASSENSIVVATSPFLSDVLATLYLTKASKVPGAVYIFHIPRPPWWHSLRRGSPLRTAAAWASAQLTLALTKIGCQLPIVMNGSRSIRDSGWRFKEGFLNLNGFQVELDSSAPAKMATQDRDIDVGYVGRLASNKGLIDLIRATQIVLRQYPSLRVLICGWAPTHRYLDRLVRLVHNRGLESSIEIRGYVSPAEKVQLQSRIKLFVCPSYEEGWSLSVMEAVSRGAFPIVYDLPAYDYLGPEAARVSVGDFHELAKTISTHLGTWSNLKNNVDELKRQLVNYDTSTVAREQLLGLENFANKRRSRSYSE